MTRPQPFVIVTGAAGFIGSQLCDVLLARGEKVLGLDNFVRGFEKNISSALNHENFSFIEMNIENEELLERAVDGFAGTPTRIWHLAANSDISAGVANPDIDLRDTFLTTYSMAKLCRKFGIREF